MVNPFGLEPGSIPLANGSPTSAVSFAALIGHYERSIHAVVEFSTSSCFLNCRKKKDRRLPRQEIGLQGLANRRPANSIEAGVKRNTIWRLSGGFRHLFRAVLHSDHVTQPLEVASNDALHALILVGDKHSGAGDLAIEDLSCKIPP
jgi:hypothetical protein